MINKATHRAVVMRAVEKQVQVQSGKACKSRLADYFFKRQLVPSARTMFPDDDAS